MSTIASPIVAAPAWRRVAFPVVVALAAAVFAVGFGAIFALLSPWTVVTVGPSDPHPELHRWHSVQFAATVGILFAGSLVALLRRPQSKPVLAQFLVAGSAAFAAAMVAFAPASVVVPAIGAFVAALYPNRRALLANPWAGPRGISWPRLALALLAAVLLAPEAARTLRWQIDGAGGEHAELDHWGLAFASAVVLVLAGLFAASRRPGAGAVAAVAGIAYLYLGLAALAIPGHDGSWGTTGGVLAALGGAAYLVMSLPGGDHSGRPPARGRATTAAGRP